MGKKIIIKCYYLFCIMQMFILFMYSNLIWESVYLVLLALKLCYSDLPETVYSLLITVINISYM